MAFLRDAGILKHFPNSFKIPGVPGISVPPLPDFPLIGDKNNVRRGSVLFLVLNVHPFPIRQKNPAPLRITGCTGRISCQTISVMTLPTAIPMVKSSVSTAPSPCSLARGRSSPAVT